MTYSVNFSSRDFSTPGLINGRIRPLSLSWSAFGGPDQAVLRMDGAAPDLLQAAGLLRSPVLISDQAATPVWWGFVSRIEVFFEGAKFEISIDDLFNKVKVTYSFISPDNRLADQYVTDYAESGTSQAEYGTKETVIHRASLDDDFAEDLRDTFLNLHQWPSSKISARKKSGTDCCAIITCSGWFATLDWQFYENLDCFYANYGPGPGTQIFGYPNYRYPGQQFTPAAACDLKYAWFLIRKIGSPTSNLTARLYSDSGGAPNAVLATSQAVAGTTLSSKSYQWTRFSFSTPYTLSGGTPYWIALNGGTSSTSNYYIMRVDENACYDQDNHLARIYQSGSWNTLANTTSPKTDPDIYFRVVCISDTGSQLLDIATAGDQFFKVIRSLTTGVQTSPFRFRQHSCLKEIKDLMTLGTSNQRMILANVSSDLVLRFYEQPDPAVPTAYMDRNGRFFTREGRSLAPHFPPVGQWVVMADLNHFTLPFDKARAPGCFIQSAKLNCSTNVLKIK